MQALPGTDISRNLMAALEKLPNELLLQICRHVSGDITQLIRDDGAHTRPAYVARVSGLVSLTKTSKKLEPAAREVLYESRCPRRCHAGTRHRLRPVRRRSLSNHRTQPYTRCPTRASAPTAGAAARGPRLNQLHQKLQSTSPGRIAFTPYTTLCRPARLLCNHPRSAIPHRRQAEVADVSRDRSPAMQLRHIAHAHPATPVSVPGYETQRFDV